MHDECVFEMVFGTRKTNAAARIWFVSVFGAGAGTRCEEPIDAGESFADGSPDRES